jgi:hypothetical protein
MLHVMSMLVLELSLKIVLARFQEPLIRLSSGLLPIIPFHVIGNPSEVLDLLMEVSAKEVLTWFLIQTVHDRFPCVDEGLQ